MQPGQAIDPYVALLSQRLHRVILQEVCAQSYIRVLRSLVARGCTPRGLTPERCEVRRLLLRLFADMDPSRIHHMNAAKQDSIAAIIRIIFLSQGCVGYFDGLGCGTKATAISLWLDTFNLRDLLTNPASLVIQCRRAVRDAIVLTQGTYKISDIGIHIPVHVMQFLMYKDLEQLQV